MTTCSGRINLQTPIRSERRRGFQPPYYTVYVYRCPACQREIIVRAGSFRGRTPVPSIGAVICGGPIPGFAPTYRGEARS
jgi:hypothetical protein